jgi:hypothetical protein
MVNIVRSTGVGVFAYAPKDGNASRVSFTLSIKLNDKARCLTLYLKHDSQGIILKYTGDNLDSGSIDMPSLPLLISYAGENRALLI